MDCWYVANEDVGAMTNMLAGMLGIVWFLSYNFHLPLLVMTVYVPHGKIPLKFQVFPAASFFGRERDEMWNGFKV